jgi:hypothetical protein
MDKPDQLVFAEDLASVEFRSGAAKGIWGVAPQEMVPADMTWPKQILWIASAQRKDAPDRLYIILDAAGYRADPPTGSFWNPVTRALLDHSKRPKGRVDSRFARVFRTDWNNGTAFYHPYDRVAAQSHPQWAKERPHLAWSSAHTIVDYLDEFHTLLNGGDYLGV